MNYSIFPLLTCINSPADLRQLPESELITLARELRLYLIEALNHSGGHFAANLGTVELAIALHYVFNTPNDHLVWDVGHQAYPHKVLTGRRDLLPTIRQTQGLAPFPNRAESVYDAFGVGHSSTSISAALGMAIAAKLDGSQQQAVAIIGDGGLTGGMAFEALNHAGSLDADLLVILNDNDMSISPNVGALNNYLTRLLSGPLFSSLRENSKKVLEKIPPVKEFAKRTEAHVKGIMTPGTLFEELGFHYYGPIDGHDLSVLLSTIRNLSLLKGPRLLHVITTKGKGYAPAETDPVKYHGVKAGFHSQAAISTNTTTSMTYSDIFGQWLCDMAAQDTQLIGITPAMCEGSGMVAFAKQYPKRYFDVGIAEQHSVTLAAGLACSGKKPVVAIYSTFLQRAYDQLIHDVAIQNLDVTFAIDRAGLVGADGPTHAGSFDLTYLRCIPNMIIMAPADENECRHMLYTAYQYPGPAAVRYPRGNGLGITIDNEMQNIPLAKADIRLQGQKIAILCFGTLLQPALAAGKELNATVINMRFVKPLDEELIKTLAKEYELLVTIEENTIAGGAGSAVAEYLNQLPINKPILHLGLPDTFIEHGDPKILLAECGLDKAGILASIKKYQTIYTHYK
jgi:1-deoxy-D-xylulose-5-phosphate synthase